MAQTSMSSCGTWAPFTRVLLAQGDGVAHGGHARPGPTPPHRPSSQARWRRWRKAPKRAVALPRPQTGDQQAQPPPAPAPARRTGTDVHVLFPAGLAGPGTSRFDQVRPTEVAVGIARRSWTANAPSTTSSAKAAAPQKTTARAAATAAIRPFLQGPADRIAHQHQGHHGQVIQVDAWRRAHPSPGPRPGRRGGWWAAARRLRSHSQKASSTSQLAASAVWANIRTVSAGKRHQHSGPKPHVAQQAGRLPRAVRRPAWPGWPGPARPAGHSTKQAPEPEILELSQAAAG